VKRHLLTAVLALVVGTLGFAVSGVALASNGNGKGGPNPCPPSEHAVYDQNGNFVSCEHNGNPSGEPGGGIGNCGQNQSGNPGNGGDAGYGNGDACVVTTTTPTETTPTETTPTDTTPTDTTPTETTPTETTPTDTTPTDTTPGATTPTETTPTETPGSPPTGDGSQPGPSSSDDSSSPSIVGQPPEQQHSTPQVSPAQAHQSSAKPAVAGTSAKSEPKPTQQPQPAPFTL
jgi:hypothetical protein